MTTFNQSTPGACMRGFTAGAALLIGLSVAHGQAWKLAIKDGAWATQIVTEFNGEILRPDRPQMDQDFLKKLLNESYERGFVVDGERVIACNTAETRAKWARMGQQGGCKLEVLESTTKVHSTRAVCPNGNSVVVQTTSVVDPETTTAVSESRSEFTPGTTTVSKSYGGSKWLGSDCKAIMEDRYTAALAEIEARQARNAEQEISAKAGDTKAILQGLLTGLQEYAAVKSARQQKSQPAGVANYGGAQAPAQQSAQQTAPTIITAPEPDITVGSLPSGGAGQCPARGSSFASKAAADKCKCGKIQGSSWQQDSKGYTCSKGIYLFGCGFNSSGKLICTQV